MNKKLAIILVAVINLILAIIFFIAVAFILLKYILPIVVPLLTHVYEKIMKW